MTLKPCPFCGAKRKLEYEPGWSDAVECKRCGAKGPQFYGLDANEGIRAWNKRTKAEGKPKLRGSDERTKMPLLQRDGLY